MRGIKLAHTFIIDLRLEETSKIKRIDKPYDDVYAVLRYYDPLVC